MGAMRNQLLPLVYVQVIVDTLMANVPPPPPEDHEEYPRFVNAQNAFAAVINGYNRCYEVMNDRHLYQNSKAIHKALRAVAVIEKVLREAWNGKQVPVAELIVIAMCLVDLTVTKMRLNPAIIGTIRHRSWEQLLVNLEGLYHLWDPDTSYTEAIQDAENIVNAVQAALAKEFPGG